MVRWGRTGVTIATVIKPTRFRDDEFKRILRNEMRSAVTVIRHDFEKTTETWKHKPVFKEHTHLNWWQSPNVRVDTDNEIYGYINDGTKPHPIYAGIYTGKSDKKALAFPSVFSAKTSPGVIGSTAGESGGPTVLAAHVNHPGNEARNFDLAIKELREPWFRDRMEEAMKEAAIASGHALSK